MASFKTVWRKGIIYIRIHHKKTLFKKVANCTSTDWDNKNLRVKKSDPNYKKINLLISKRLNEYRGLELDYDNEGIDFNVSDLVQKKKPITVLKCLNDYIDYLEKAERKDAKRKNENIRDHISKFEDVSIKQLDLKYLKNLELHLLKTVSKNTTFKYFSTLKTALKYSGYSPIAFNQIKLSRTKPTQVSLTIEEFVRLENFKAGKDQVFLDAHLLQYYTWGTRIANALTFTTDNLTDTTIEFYEVKDNPNKKIVPLTDKIRALLDRNSEFKHYYLIPLLKSEKQIQSKTAMINSKLKVIAAKLDINKRLTTHVARYSFSTWLDEMNVPLKHRKDMLNHSNERMTEHYSQAEKDIKKLGNYADLLFK